MNPNPYLKQYQKNEVETASPEKILIMLYDGAIQFLNIARIEMTADKKMPDYEKINKNLVGAQNILTEFQETLDMEAGGDFAQKLYGLYEYLHGRLVHANIKKDISALDEVLGHLKGLRDTWKQAIALTASQANGSILYNKNDEEADFDEEGVRVGSTEARG